MLKYHAATKSYRIDRTNNTLNEKTITGIHHFSKTHLIPLHFYERPTLEPLFTNQKKSKEDCHLFRG